MKHARNVWLVVVSGALALTAAAGCTTSEKVGETQQALASQNGLTTNSLTRNSLTRNSLTRNSLTRNSLTRNSLTRNSLTRNALTLTNDALATLQSGGATSTDLQQERDLRASARKLLEYVYSCAMPPDASVSLDFPTDGTDGSTCDGGTLSADGLTCSYGTITGQLDLAPSWGTDACDETCQRWVSACVLARTNYYGVRVDISIRGAHPALAASDDEKAQYPLREGTYFGNIFSETTDASSNVVWTPQYHACGGPGSNEPMVTKRFCSSTAAGCIIDVQPSCACPEVDASAYPQSYYSAFAGDPSSFLSVGLSFTCDTTTRSCSSVGADGAMTGCYSDTGVAYPESVTVFLKNAAICGNGICETGEDSGSCSNDCLPGVWATRYSSIADTYTTGVAALSDESLVMSGISNTWEPVDLGLGDIFPVDAPNVAKPFVGRFASNGQLLWGHPLKPPVVTTSAYPLHGDIPQQSISVVATTHDDHIVAAGDTWSCCYGTGSTDVKEAWVMSLNKDGTTAWQHAYVTGDRHTITQVRAIDSDASNNVVFAGNFTSPVSFGGATLTSTGHEDIYIVKLDASGSHLWSKSFGAIWPSGAGSQDFVQSMDVDAAGNIVLLGCQMGVCDWLAKLGPDGTMLWSKHIGAEAQRVTTDAAGNIYLAGTLSSSFDFGGGPLTGTFPAVYVTTYTSAGDYASAQLAASGTGGIGVSMLQVDASGGVFIGGGFTQQLTSGTTTFDGGEKQDLYVAKVTSSGPSWIKQFGGALTDLFGGAIAVNGRVIVTGGLQAAMLFEQKLLVASTPAPPDYGYWGDIFMGSFPDPTAGAPNDSCAFVAAGTPCVDRDAPVITMAPSNGVESYTYLPAIIIEAVGPTFDLSRVVTAIDDHDGPVAVDCRQLDYALQPIEEVNPTNNPVAGRGWNHMSCKATDRAGNFIYRRLTLWIKDVTPPVVLPPTVTVFEATTATGASVVYFPNITDDWGLSTTEQPYCYPYSGGAFPLGTTTVTCSAKDGYQNVGGGSFGITVQFSWSGFTAPTAGQTFTRGSTVKAAFTLTGGSKAVTNAVAQLYYAPIVNGVVGAETNAASFAYSRKTGYSASFATRKMAAGTYRLRVDLHDGVLRTTTIKLI